MITAIPKYDHIVNGSVYIRPLEAKQLLQWSGKELLTSESARLYRSITNAMEAYIELGLGNDIERDSDYKEVIAPSQAVFKSSKAALESIAACNVAQGLKNDAQRTAASGMLEKHALVISRGR